MEQFEAISLEMLGNNNFPDITVVALKFDLQTLLIRCTGTVCDVFDQILIEGEGVLRVNTQQSEVIEWEVKRDNSWQTYIGKPLLTQIYRLITDDEQNLFLEGVDQQGQIFKITVPLAQIAWLYREGENEYDTDIS